MKTLAKWTIEDYHRMIEAGILCDRQAVQSINQTESLFGLSRAAEEHFFSEWTENLLELTAAETASLDRVKNSHAMNCTMFSES